MELNAGMVIPLYRQVMDDLRDQVDRGELSPGDKIPSEAELSELYSVSRITVRRAVEELANAGMLTKRQGKGTYVNPPKLLHKVVQRRDLRTFADTCVEAGRRPFMRRLRCERASADADVRRFLDIAGLHSVLHVRTLGLADDVPMLLEDDYLPYDDFAFLEELDFAGESVFKVMAERGDHHPTSVDYCRLEIVRADGETSALLEVPVAEPLFHIDAHLRDDDGRPLVVSRAFVVGSLFAFDLP